MNIKTRIIEISDEILNHLLDFKKTHPDFTFSLRTRDSVMSQEKRLSKGQWFQGSDYIYVPLFKKGDNARKIKTIGFTLGFNEDTSVRENYVEVSFKAGVTAENEIRFHKELAERLNIVLDHNRNGRVPYDQPENYLSNLDDYITNTRPIALELLEKYNLTNSKKYIISEEEFQKNLSRINKIKENLKREGSNHVEDSEEMKTYIDLLEYKKQLILQGPPGTGKTYNVKNIAEKMIFPKDSISQDKTLQKQKLEDSGQFKLVQFHPSYSYEDFVRGITAKGEGEKITYETENKVLALFAEEALNNLKASKKDIKDFSWEQKLEELLIEFSETIQDKIDDEGEFKITDAVSIIAVEADAFRYSGKWQSTQRMKFKDLIRSQINGVKTRQEFKKQIDISGLANQHATYFFKVLELFRKDYKEQLKQSLNKLAPKPELKNYVLVIDEINRANLPSVLGELIYALEYRNESVESMYAIDDDFSITLPENLFILGTMNTADRSVGHIDYAIKRRFAFASLLPNSDVIENQKAKELFEKVKNLFIDEDEVELKNSDHLATDFDYKDVQIGHSYFILNSKTEEEQHLELHMKLHYEIVPLLREYIKDGLLLESATELINEIEEFEC